MFPQRIIARLKSENIIYVVPNGADDDWYWLYATIAGNRTKLAYVITNDLIRDHGVAFSSPRCNARWKSSHIVHFDLSKAVVDDNSADIVVSFTNPGASITGCVYVCTISAQYKCVLFTLKILFTHYCLFSRTLLFF